MRVCVCRSYIIFGGYGADGDNTIKKYDDKISKLANVTFSSDLNLPHRPFTDSFVLMDLFGSSKSRLDEHKVTENTCYHDFDDVDTIHNSNNTFVNKTSSNTTQTDTLHSMNSSLSIQKKTKNVDFNQQFPEEKKKEITETKQLYKNNKFFQESITQKHFHQPDN